MVFGCRATGKGRICWADFDPNWVGGSRGDRRGATGGRVEAGRRGSAAHSRDKGLGEGRVGRGALGPREVTHRERCCCTAAWRLPQTPTLQEAPVLADHSARSAPSFLKMPVDEASSFSWPPSEWYRFMSTCAAGTASNTPDRRSNQTDDHRENKKQRLLWGFTPGGAANTPYALDARCRPDLLLRPDLLQACPTGLHPGSPARWPCCPAPRSP